MTQTLAFLAVVLLLLGVLGANGEALFLACCAAVGAVSSWRADRGRRGSVLPRM